MAADFTNNANNVYVFCRFSACFLPIPSFMWFAQFAWFAAIGFPDFQKKENSLENPGFRGLIVAISTASGRMLWREADSGAATY